MSDVDGIGDVWNGGSPAADGLRGSPKETGTERSGVEASGFKPHRPHHELLRQLEGVVRGESAPTVRLVLDPRSNLRA
jgi:hypothetical protein